MQPAAAEWGGGWGPAGGGGGGEDDLTPALPRHQLQTHLLPAPSLAAVDSGPLEEGGADCSAAQAAQGYTAQLTAICAFVTKSRQQIPTASGKTQCSDNFIYSNGLDLA